MEKFLSEGVDLKTISRISSAAGDAHYFDDSTTPSKVREYLDSIRELDTLKGMKWLLAMMSKGRDVSDFFPHVVKNVVAKSVEVKKWFISTWFIMLTSTSLAERWPCCL